MSGHTPGSWHLEAEWSRHRETQRRCREAIAQRDELLEALRKCKTCALPTEVRDLVNAAIAKATGSTS